MNRVLVVDDDALIRFSLSAVLRTEHTEITAVGTGAAAIRELDLRTYDTCFLDLHLPDISGLDVMKIIREVCPSTRIAIMTGDQVEEELMAFILKHAQLFLEKPFDLQLAKRFLEGGEEERKGLRRDQKAIANGLECSRRICERKPVAMTVRYLVLEPDAGRREERLAASVVDISSAGMGILTYELLRPGQSVELIDGTVRRGTVRWSKTVESENVTRAGIQYA